MRKLTDSNRFSIVRPNLMSEWNFEKNANLSPCMFSFGSHKKVWWRCENDHEWEAQINDRSNGYGCPYCSGSKVNQENCLTTKNPALSLEWNVKRNVGLSPNNFTSGSNKKVWWKCSRNHEWEAQINNRNNGSGCPYCSGQMICEENSLNFKFPDLVYEWHPTKNVNLKPSDVTAHSSKCVWWKCKNDHEWNVRVVRRTTSNEGCPYCSGHRVCKENSILHNAKYLLSEWNYNKNRGISPKDVSYGSSKRIWWKCKNDHEWVATPYNRIIGCTGCPVCSKIRLNDGMIFDSIPEAYFYLKFIKGNYSSGDVMFNKKYPALGSHRFDFYLVRENTYIEVTGYSERSSGWAKSIWARYKKTIALKKDYVENILKAKFVFNQLDLTKKQVRYVRKYTL